MLLSLVVMHQTLTKNLQSTDYLTALEYLIFFDYGLALFTIFYSWVLYHADAKDSPTMSIKRFVFWSRIGYPATAFIAVGIITFFFRS